MYYKQKRGCPGRKKHAAVPVFLCKKRNDQVNQKKEHTNTKGRNAPFCVDVFSIFQIAMLKKQNTKIDHSDVLRHSSAAAFSFRIIRPGRN